MKARITEDLRFIQVYDYTPLEIKQIRHSFKKRISNWRFNPLVKKGLWDGYINFIDKANRIPLGLWNELSNICKQFGFDFSIDDNTAIFDKTIDRDHFIEWVNVFFKDAKKFPRDYQIESALNMMIFKRDMSEIATSAGKTLIIFMVFMYLKSLGKVDKTLVIVPNTNLILQTIDEFNEFNDGKERLSFQTIHGKSKKEKQDVDIVIGTYQSLVKLEPDWFEEVNSIIVDECHHTHAKSIKTIISNITYVDYVIGMSGTLKGKKDSAESFTLQAYLGPEVNNISADFLIQNNYASAVKVKVVRLRHKKQKVIEGLAKIRSRRKSKDGSKLLAQERRLIIEDENRFDFIMNILKKTTKNSLVLFADIKYGYGQKIYNHLRNTTQKKLFYIDGDTPIEKREDYFQMMEQNHFKKMVEFKFNDKVLRKELNQRIKLQNGSFKKAENLNKSDKIEINGIIGFAKNIKEIEVNDGIMLIASFGTTSTGISIDNIHNIFLMESFKSDRIIRQTIGRGMRKMLNKDGVVIWDFVDDLCLMDGSKIISKNYLYKHGEERLTVFKSQKFPYKIYKIDI